MTVGLVSHNGHTSTGHSASATLSVSLSRASPRGQGSASGQITLTQRSGIDYTAVHTTGPAGSQWHGPTAHGTATGTTVRAGLTMGPSLTQTSIAQCRLEYLYIFRVTPTHDLNAILYQPSSENTARAA